MSLLMEALKQQQGAAASAPVAAHQRFWRPLALGTLVLLGIGIGFGITYWLTPTVTSSHPATDKSTMLTDPASSSAVASTTTELAVSTPAAAHSLPPAHPGLILSDLLAVPADSEPEQLVISAQRGGAVQAILPEQDQFNELPPMAEAATTEPVLDEPLTAPELHPDEVPEALRQKFQFAVEATSDPVRRAKVIEHAAPARDIRTLDDILQRQIPPLRFEAHVYASDPAQRWVKVNGKDLQEGQWVTADIQIKEITANYVLLQTGRQLFSIEALTDWSYRIPVQR
jgi:hypothetical protein